MTRPTTGQRVTVCTDATILRVSDSHGLCYEVALVGDNDFDRERRIWLNPEEVLSAEDKEALRWLSTRPWLETLSRTTHLGQPVSRALSVLARLVGDR
jgi:hypothetical protein